MKTGLKVFIGTVIAVLVVFFSYQIGIYTGEQNILQTPPDVIANPNPDSEELQKVDFSVFWEAWRDLERNFYKDEKIDPQEMVYGAIKGMVATLDDPYTTFFDPKKTQEFDEELSGKYEGVGMEVAMRGGMVTVVSPLENTPAQRAGMSPGDKIIKIGDTETKSLTLEGAVQMIRGPEGTDVTITVDRSSWESPREITLTRASIKIPTLDWEMKTAENGEEVSYIKIYQFNDLLSSEFRSAALKTLNSGTNKIIVDLRNNPGGYLHTAIDVASWFIPSEDVITWQDFGGERDRKAYKSTGPASFSEYEIVVLINEGSASASEILAGALRDHLGSTLVGQKSFGKGSVQEQLYLSDNSSIKITVSEWLTPDGTSINEEGIEPDVEVEMTEEDFNQGRDPQLEKAMEIISK